MEQTKLKDKYRLNEKEVSLIINLANNFDIDLNDRNQAEKLVQMYVFAKLYMKDFLTVKICNRCGSIRTYNIKSNICGTCADDLRDG